MDIKQLNDLPLAHQPISQAGDLLARIKAAGTIEAEVIKLLQDQLLLSTRLGQILTSNKLHYKPGDHLILRLGGSSQNPVLKVSQAPPEPVTLDSNRHPQLSRLLPREQAVLAAVTGVSAQKTEIKLGQQILSLPRLAGVTRGQLLTLLQDRNPAIIEIRPLDKKPIYKAILKRLLPQRIDGKAAALVKLLNLATEIHPKTKALEATTSRSDITAGAKNTTPNSISDKPPLETKSPRVTSYSALKSSALSKPPIQLPPVKSTAATGPEQAPIVAPRPQTTRPVVYKISQSPTDPARVAVSIESRVDSTTTKVSSAPSELNSQSSQPVQKPVEQLAKSKQQPAWTDSRIRAQPIIHAHKPPDRTSTDSTTPDWGSANKVSVKSSGDTGLINNPRLIKTTPDPRSTDPLVAPREALAQTIKVEAASVQTPNPMLQTLQPLLQSIPNIPDIDGSRVMQWFSFSGLGRSSNAKLIASPGIDPFRVLQQFAQLELMAREFDHSAQSSRKPGTTAETASGKSPSSDPLLMLIREAAKLVEQALSHNLLQRASLGLQQETQQSLSLSFALPFIDEQQVKPLHIDVRQGNPAEDDGDQRWDIRLSFEFANLGQISCHVILEGIAVAASFYCEQSQTRARLEQALPELRKQLSSAGFNPGDFHSFLARQTPESWSKTTSFSEFLVDVEV